MPYLRGVNVCGAEFGATALPGVLGENYTFNSEDTFRYFGECGLGLIRLAIRWERLQPVLQDVLDADYLAGIQQNVAWARAHGCRVILNVQNYGRYKIDVDGGLREYVIDNEYDGAVPVRGEDLADLWRRVAGVFTADEGVYGYGLMNEPHDMGSADWKQISQKVVDAIRDTGDGKLILVPGNRWASAPNWRSANGRASWIHDDHHNFAYEAHLYFDADGSGEYRRSYDDELDENSELAHIGSARLKPFANWCRANGVRGYLGEYGVPGDDPRWLAVLDDFLNALDAAGMDGTYWAAGEWWGEYRLSVQPDATFSINRPQLAVLQAHAFADPT